MSLSLEGNAQGSRFSAKTDEELLREYRYDQIHRLAIDRSTSERGRTPEMSAGPSILEGDALGSFDIDCADSKNYCGYPQ